MFGDKIKRKRRSLAHSLERACVPERPYIGRGPRYLVQPEVTLACAPSLRALAAALRDDAIAFDGRELDAIKAFVCDGPSAFFGRDATAAKREAVRLQHAVLDPKPGTRGRTRAKHPNAHVRHPSPSLTSSARRTTTISTGTLAISALLVAVVVVAPAALGASFRAQLRQHAASVVGNQPATASSPCPCNVGLPGGPSAGGAAAGSALIAKRVGTGLVATTKAAPSSSPCPCNVGLPGGPSAVGVPGVGRFFAGPKSGGRVTSNKAATVSSPCPCNVGLPGGPSAVGLPGGARLIITRP